MRICYKCKIAKSLSAFTKDKRTAAGRRYQCRGCESNYKYKKRYGISFKLYLLLLKKQHYRCKICSILDTECRYKKLNIDHCHKTNKVRGLLCGNCNKAIGLLKDNLTLVVNAAKYLNRFKEKHG